MNGKMSKGLVALLALIASVALTGCWGDEDKTTAGTGAQGTTRPAICGELGLTDAQCDKAVTAFNQPSAMATITPQCRAAGVTDTTACAKIMAAFATGSNVPPAQGGTSPVVAPADDGGKQVVTPTPVPTPAAPYNLPPQPLNRHSSLYLETGVPCPKQAPGLVCKEVSANTRTWTLDVIAGTTMIIGGFTVDGASNGVYKAFAGPTTVTTTVTNGFTEIIKQEDNWDFDQWCFRLWETHAVPSAEGKPDWGRANRNPLPGWAQCANVGYDTGKSGVFK